MSKFFDQYSSILEKNLQRVRLKVDPLNKYAEDFAQYNGYEGYILAETEDSIKFFTNKQIVMIPKKAVIVEGILSGLAGTANAGDSSASTAVGTIGRNIAGTAARAMFGSGVTGTGNSNSGYASGSKDAKDIQSVAPNKQPVIAKIPNDMASKSFAIVDNKGTASFLYNNKTFYISKIQLNNSSKKILESKDFNDVLRKHTKFLNETLAAEGYYDTPPAAYAKQPAAPQQQPTATQPTATQQPAAAAPSTATPQQQPAPTTPALSAKKGVRFVDINAKPEFINEQALIIITEQATNQAYRGYGSLTHIPNSTNLSIAFSSQQP